MNTKKMRYDYVHLRSKQNTLAVGVPIKDRQNANPPM